MKIGDFWFRRLPTSGTGSMLVTPSDTADLVHPDGSAQLAMTLYVEGGGTVTFVGADGQTDTWNCPANFYLSVPIKRVKATGTTATGIHAIW